MIQNEQTKNEDRELAELNASLVEKALRLMSGPGDYPTAVSGLKLHRRDETNRLENCFYKPIAALTLQGAKRTVIGTREYRYGALECMVAGVDLPSASYITHASPEQPYLVISLELDNHITTRLAAELPASGRRSGSKGIAVAPVNLDIMRAFHRLADLLDKPEQVPVLGPIYLREIHYHLLMGPQGEVLRQINTVGTQSNQVFKAIGWMKNNFKQSLAVEELARSLNMAAPTFRKHFKSITTMSPLQYQKTLRLYEAQRLMLVGKADATEAGYEVGYESPTQFNREYKRLFGEPPATNANNLR